MKNEDFGNLDLKQIHLAEKRLRRVVYKTPLEFNERLSLKYKAKIFLKREDLQSVRSYKIRGAYNLISSLSSKEKKRGVVCASAGNHAQGVALSCKMLRIKAVIFMPRPTPKQKIDRVLFLGEKFVEVILSGDTFDEAQEKALKYQAESNKVFIPPFNHPLIISGQATVATEIFSQLAKEPQYIIIPVGGGGLISGIGYFTKETKKKSIIVGVEPKGAAAMYESLKKGKIVELAHIDKFVDGAAVKKVGDFNFEISKKVINKMMVVDEGEVCSQMLDLYQKDGVIAEPAGALSVAALNNLAPAIRGKTVVCIISGGNNDVTRYAEITERALVYKGLKHYFIIEFSQRPGALRRYLDEALGPNDDITLFEYVKKNNRESGPALIGVELIKKEDFKPLLSRMDKIGLHYELVKPDSVLFRFLI